MDDAFSSRSSRTTVGRCPARTAHRSGSMVNRCVVRTLRILVLLPLLLAWDAAAGAAPAVAIDANYPGGNIVVERMEGDTVYLRPDLRDTEGWWFYWSFRIQGVQGRTLTFRFSGPNPIGVRGPAVSTDQGRTWAWLGTEALQEGSFRYTFAAEEPVAVRVSGPPSGPKVRPILAI